MNIENIISDKIKLVESKMSDLLSGGNPPEIYDAVRYSALSGGKRMRAILNITFCEALGGNADEVLPFAAAIEMIHAYSLIHDDLPALDNDDFRRGKPSCHKMFGEAIAILAGDALLNRAYEVMAEECVKSGKKAAAAMSVIAVAAGIKGMVGGQTTDILYENKKADMDTLLFIHKNKTAALIKASIVSGAIIAGVEKTETLERLGEDLGLAFQIKDDILDMTGDAAILGKPIGSDAKNNKSTYVTLKGLEAAQADFEKLSTDVFKVYKGLNTNNPFLEKYLEFLVNRTF